jgi:hypothetical protein
MNDRLVAFMYLLMRDDLPPGEVERLVLEAEKTEIGPYRKEDYTNKHLAKYAVEIVRRLSKRKSSPSLKRQAAARAAGLAKLAKKKFPDSSENQ